LCQVLDVPHNDKKCNRYLEPNNMIFIIILTTYIYDLRKYIDSSNVAREKKSLSIVNKFLLLENILIHQLMLQEKRSHCPL